MFASAIEIHTLNRFTMAKLLLIILLASLSVWKNVVHGKGVCSHYDEEGCVHPDVTKHGHYTNQWSIYAPGMTMDKVKQMMENNGYIYEGPVKDIEELHVVTKKDIPEKHVMLNEGIIEELKNIENVQSVAQKHVFNDQVYSVTDTNEVELQHLDPDSIVLNDGSDNWKRIAMVTLFTEDQRNEAKQFSRPISNNPQQTTDDDEKTSFAAGRA